MVRDTYVTHADDRHVTRGVRTRAENDELGNVVIVVRDEMGALVREIPGEKALELKPTSSVSRTLIVDHSVEPDAGETTPTRGPLGGKECLRRHQSAGTIAAGRSTKALVSTRSGSADIQQTSSQLC